MKILIKLFIFTTVLFINSVVEISANDEFNVDKLIQIGEIEPINVGFKNSKYSIDFINKFKLNKYELQLIGEWLRNDFISYTSDNKVAIMYVDFLPNRILSVYCNINTKFYYIFLDWKSDSNDILVKPISVILTDDNNKKNVMINNLEYFGYFKISKMEYFQKGYYQNENFYWNEILIKLGLIININYVDCLRIRHYFPNIGENIYHNLDNNSVLKDFLMNANYKSSYFLNLIEYLK